MSDSAVGARKTSVWRGSLLGRMFVRLGEYARYGWMAAFFRFWGRQYGTSVFKRVLDSFLGAPASFVTHSRFFGLGRRCILAFHRWGGRIQPYLGQSTIVLFFRRIRHSTAMAGSVFFRFGAFTWRHFFLFIFALYLPLDIFLRQVVQVEFLASNWDELFLIVCFLYLLVSPFLSERPAGSSATPLDAPLVFFICLALFLMLVVSPLFGVAISGFRAVCQFMLWFFIIARLAKGRQEILFVVSMLALLGFGLALHGIYQFIVAAPIPASWVSVKEAGVRTRAFSIVGSPNILGDLMVMLAPHAAALVYVVRRPAAKFLFFVATVCMGLCCLFTFSRGAWMGLAVAIILFALLRDRRLLLVLVLGGTALMFVPQVFNRIAFLFTSDFTVNNETGGRAMRWTQGMSILNRSNPILGFGLGRFGGAVAMQNQTVDTVNYFYLDNYYMKTLVEMGYLGLSGYLFLLASLLVSGLRALFRTRKVSMDYTLCCGLLAGMMGVLTHSFFENIFEVPYMNAYFWGMAALLMVIGFKLHTGRVAGTASKPTSVMASE